MLHLTEAEKILVLAVCGGLLVLTVVLTACVVVPTCWLSICLQKISKKRKMKYANVGLEEGTFIKLSGTPRYTVETGTPVVRSVSKTESDASQGIIKAARKREDSTYSSMSSSSQGNVSVSNYSEVSVDATVTDGDLEINYGQVTFSLWCKMDEAGATGQLIVVLKEAQDLPPRPYGGTCDPYVLLYLLRDKGRKRWSKSQSSVLYKFRTTTKRKTQHPLFKETFVMDIGKADLREDALKFAAYDEEKYANDSEVGEVVVPLRDVPLARNGEEHQLTVDFLEPKQENGEILFGLSYLPTAERLTINVIKANNLRAINDIPEQFNPFVRVLLMLNGKHLKKKKTSTKKVTTTPVFNECLTFDVPPQQLDHVVFLIVVSHNDNPDNNDNNAVVSPESPSTPPGTTKKGRHVGKVVIGSGIRGLAYSHWNAMKQSPRKQVTQWHTLR